MNILGLISQLIGIKTLRLTKTKDAVTERRYLKRCRVRRLKKFPNLHQLYPAGEQSRPSVVVSQPSPRMKSLNWEALESANDRRALTWSDVASATMSMSFSLSTILWTSLGVSLGTEESMSEVMSRTPFSLSFRFKSGPFGKKERESFKAKP